MLFEFCALDSTCLTVLLQKSLLDIEAPALNIRGGTDLVVCTSVLLDSNDSEAVVQHLGLILELKKVVSEAVVYQVCFGFLKYHFVLLSFSSIYTALTNATNGD
jgi:hypothetical protein